MPLDDPKTIPTEMEVERSKGLTIVWGDGKRCFYPVKLLRVRCPCATCREVRKNTDPLRVIDDKSVVPDDVTIVDAHEVGAYALGFTFSDGHATGIYDFRYLREICPEG